MPHWCRDQVCWCTFQATLFCDLTTGQFSLTEVQIFLRLSSFPCLTIDYCAIFQASISLPTLFSGREFCLPLLGEFLVLI